MPFHGIKDSQIMTDKAVFSEKQQHKNKCRPYVTCLGYI